MPRRLSLLLAIAAATAPLAAQPARQIGPGVTAATHAHGRDLAAAIAVARPDSARLALIRQRPDTQSVRPIDPARIALNATLLKTIVTPAATDSHPVVVRRADLERFLGVGVGQLKLVRTGRAVPIAATDSSVSIQRGDGVFSKVAAAPRLIALPATHTVNPKHPVAVDTVSRQPAGALYQMPYRWLVVDSAGVTRLLIPYLRLVGEGLHFDPDSGFVGSALVGVEDSLHAADGTQALTNPLALMLNATNGGVLSKQQLKIAHTSQDYELVHVMSSDTMSIRLTTGADKSGILFPVPLIQPRFGLRAVTDTIEGFGLATTDVTISLPIGMAAGESATVALSGGSVHVEPSTVTVKAGAPATVRLRSGSLGPHTITASIGAYEVGQTTVYFQPPWSFLSATILGVLLGGLARFVSAKRRKKFSTIWWDVLKGFPFGVIAAAASAVGLDLVGLGIKEPSAWIAVMVIAAVGAWMGSKLLDARAAAPKPA